jgi:hypothetical protein
MLSCNSVATPSTQGTIEISGETAAPYRLAVGKLMFLANVSKPEIAYVTENVARKASSPTSGD